MLVQCLLLYLGACFSSIKIYSKILDFSSYAFFFWMSFIIIIAVILSRINVIYGYKIKSFIQWFIVYIFIFLFLYNTLIEITA